LVVTTLFVIVFITFGFHKRSPSNRFDKVVIFGDSFSDTRLVYRLTNHTKPTGPHFYQDRYCDGPIWVDRLEVPEKYCYAVGGAVTDNDIFKGLLESPTFRVPGVRQQIVTYLEEARKNNFDIALPLYIIWIGYNNFVLNPTVDPKLVVDSLIKAIQDLLAVGAKNFLIFNEAPFQAFPHFRKFNKAEFYTQLTDSFNKELEERLETLQRGQPKTSIYMFDNHALITKIISKKSSTTFTNTMNECWKRYSINSGESRCPNPKQYVFYDEIHFSSSIHQLITNAIQSFLSFNFRKNTYILPF
jgi:outer membrane lipase/esterase